MRSDAYCTVHAVPPRPSRWRSFEWWCSLWCRASTPSAKAAEGRRRPHPSLQTYVGNCPFEVKELQPASKSEIKTERVLRMRRWGEENLELRGMVIAGRIGYEDEEARKKRQR